MPLAEKSMLLLNRARILTPFRTIENGAVLISGREVVQVMPGGLEPAPDNARIIDLPGCTVIPGLIDMHIHGALGADVLDADSRSISTIAQFLARSGTTSFLPTTVSASWGQLEQAAGAIEKAQQAGLPGARVLGLHLEGPFLNPARRGAQNPAALQAVDIRAVAELLKYFPNLVRVVTLAPELPGAVDCVKYLAERHIVVAAGHTEADYSTMKAAFAAGLSHAVHLFNGMGPLHHREPGPVGAVLSTPGVTCEVIADGHHLHPAVVQLVVSLKAPHDIVLVTDAMRATGLPDGPYDLGGLVVHVRGGVTKTETGSLAGSTLTMLKAVQNAVAFTGLPLASVIAWATVNPARLLGLNATKGEIAAGKDADITVLDQDFNVVLTIVEGTVVVDNRHAVQLEETQVD